MDFRQKILDMAIAEQERMMTELDYIRQFIVKQRQEIDNQPTTILQRNIGRTDSVLQVISEKPGLNISQIAKAANESGQELTTQQASTTVFNLKKRGKIREEDRKYFAV